MTFEMLHNDMVAAMKARDKARKAVISTLIADVKAKTQARYFVLEHDKPLDAIRFARQSMDTLKNYGV